MPSMDVDAPCPACRRDGLTLETVTHEIAYFGDVIESVLRCGRCGYRTSQTLITEQSQGTRHRLDVETEDHLQARVIRSTSCTVRVPQLGVEIEPAAASDAYITNVEGVLQRIRGVLDQVRRGGTDDQADKAEDLLDAADAMVDSETAFTVVLDDPMGNSAIVHDDAASRRLRDDEIDELATGMTLYDVEE